MKFFVFWYDINCVSLEVIHAIFVFIEITKYGTMHSFNISLLVGIVLWDIYNKIN